MRVTVLVKALIFATALCWSIPAAAAAGDCEEAKSVRGPVTEVRISSGKIRLPSGEPANTPHRDERWTYLANRRRITIVKYQADPFSIGYPTIVCEYDQGGRLTTQTLKLNGWTAYTVTTFQYDTKGRLIVRDTRSKNPQFTRTVTYEYGNATVTERLSSASFLVKHLDAEGEVLKEVAYSGRAGELPVTTMEYLRTPGEVKACWSGESPGCHTTQFDRWGNIVEGRSGRIVDLSNTYEIDARGNWTKRVSARNSDGKTPATADITFREIVYRAR